MKNDLPLELREPNGVTPHGEVDPGTVAAATVLLVVVGVFAAFWATTVSMVTVWTRSETFAHGYVVLPIFCYLLWRDRRRLADVQPNACYPALAGVAGCGFLWLAGDWLNVVGLTHFALVAMIVFTLWAGMGTQILKELAFPIGILFFAVPFGEFLVPQLIDWTANFTIYALRASGVPVYREGNFFTIPTGRWSVVEACSGLRYLIATLFVGALYAYFSYQSTRRRTAFIFVAAGVALVANWLRAYLIVMIGHLSSNRLAVGVDHVIYGWVFFGLVIGCLFWIGSRWHEPEALTPRPAGQSAATGSARIGTRTWLALAAAFAVLAPWQPLAARLEHARDANPLQPAAVRPANGWGHAPESAGAWRPDLAGSRGELRQVFAKDGARVTLDVVYYRDQTNGSKAITSTNRLVRSTNATWHEIGMGTTRAELGPTSLAVPTSVVTDGTTRLVVWHWFWVDGRVTSSEYVAKLYEALALVRGGTDATAWVVAYSQSDGDEARARSRLAAFAGEMAPAVSDAIGRTFRE